MFKVDLNADLGESFGAYTIGMDAEVLKYITSANVACGFHAGDPVVMQKTVALAKENGTAVGAHPGFPDIMGFGRRNLNISPDEAYAYTKYQVGALLAFTKSAGIKLQHVKPHGAFYNMAAVNTDLSLAICRGIYDCDKDLILLGLAGSEHINAAKQVGLRYAGEVFADRGYNEDGTLVARSKPGAMIHDREQAIVRTVRMVKEGKVKTVTGKDIDIKADSICVHGDNPDAVGFVKEIHQRLENEGITVTNIASVISK
ncbi:MAG: 5-oxoprolinase subunit PxpA [Oscillospiraceae bacterium]|nr:5-oxoprolinase subunit PxpA [Candidatus Equicaccousia limihippi]